MGLVRGELSALWQTDIVYPKRLIGVLSMPSLTGLSNHVNGRGMSVLFCMRWNPVVAFSFRQCLKRAGRAFLPF